METIRPLTKERRDYLFIFVHLYEPETKLISGLNNISTITEGEGVRVRNHL